jgi:prefoldin beta subunit
MWFSQKNIKNKFKIKSTGVKNLDIPPKMQQQLAQFEQLRQQMQLIGNQRLTLESKIKEVEMALEELEQLDDNTPIYQSVGSLMIKASSREDIIAKLKEDKETTEFRVKTVQKQEEQLKARYEELQVKLSEALKKFQGSGLA